MNRAVLVFRDGNVWQIEQHPGGQSYKLPDGRSFHYLGAVRTEPGLDHYVLVYGEDLGKKVAAVS